MASAGLRTMIRAGAAGVGVVLVVIIGMKWSPKAASHSTTAVPTSAESQMPDHADEEVRNTSESEPEQAPAERKPFAEGKLLVGDPVPPLSIARWFRGEPTTELEPGTTYLIEFWATWCGPCIRAMPHLSQMQEHHADDGFRVIAVSIDKAPDAEDLIEQFIQNKGDIARFDIAFDSGQTSRDWFQAAGQTGIPASFVVDRTGTLAWIGNPLMPDGQTGHPMVDTVVQQVLDGTYDLASATNEARGAVAGEVRADEHASEIQSLTDQMSQLWTLGHKA